MLSKHFVFLRGKLFLPFFFRLLDRFHTPHDTISSIDG